MSHLNVLALSKRKSLVRSLTDLLKSIVIREESTSSAKHDPCKQRKVILDPCCKIAVIAGGAEGIGLAAGKQLLCEKANHVVLLGLDTSKGLDAVNMMNCAFGKNKCTFIKCDIANKNEIQDVIGNIKTQFQMVDIFINTAGIWDETKWEDELRINLIGAINFNLALMKCFPQSNATVINFCGVQGLQHFPPSPIFAAEHAGIIHFSQSLGHPNNYKTIGLRIMTLCTGSTTCTEFLNGVDGKMLTSAMGKDLHDCLEESQKQKPDACGKAVVELVKYGTPGSIWVIEGSRLVYLDLPDWRKHRILVSQFL